MTRLVTFVGAALLPLLLDPSARAQQPEMERDQRPGALRLFEQAVEQAPGLAVGPAEKEAPQERDRYPWAVAPPQTQAISFVRNMQDFSDKLDHVAERMDREPPGILRYSMRLAKINDGLLREGSLMWFFGEPGRTTGIPVVYALPAVDHERLIQRLNPIAQGGFKKVEFEGEPSKSVAIDGYSLFANLDDTGWLFACSNTAGGFDRKMGPLNDFLARQDIGFAMTDPGFLKNTPVRLPFSDGNRVVPTALTRSAQLFLGFAGATELAAGMEMIPAVAVRASAAASLDPGSEMAHWAATMELERDELLAKLPSVPASLVFASSSCAPWNQRMNVWLKKIVREQNVDDGAELAEMIDLQGLRGVTLMLEPYEDVQAGVTTPLHIQVHVQDAELAFAQSHLFLQAFLAGKPGGWTVTLKRERIALRDVLVFQSKPDAELPVAAPVTVGCLTTLDDQTLLIQGGSRARLVGILNSIEQRKQLVDSPTIQTTLGFVQPDAQQILLLDVFQAFQLAKGLEQRFPGFGSLESLEPFFQPFENRPLLGMTNRFELSRVETQVAAPTELLTPLADLGARALPLLFFLSER